MAPERRMSATAPSPAARDIGLTGERTIGDVLEEAARRWGDATAFVAPGDLGTHRTWTFSQLRGDAKRVARALLRRYEPGEHVAIWAANLAEWPLVELGAALAGLTLVTVNPAYRAAELTHVLRQSRASGVLVQPHYRGTDLLAVVGSVRPDLPSCATSSASSSGMSSWLRR